MSNFLKVFNEVIDELKKEEKTNYINVTSATPEVGSGATVASAKSWSIDSSTEKEAVNHPSHYNQHKWEVIDVLEEFFKDDPLIWQVGKYILRYKYKAKPIEDLKKALWYLQYKIDHYTTEETKPNV